ncbi:hypothetical protein ACWDR1_00885 [Streptosporangium sandarakinum]
MPTVLSSLPLPLPLWQEVLPRNIEAPVSKEKLRSVLSMPTLSELVIEPGLLLQVNPCLPLR